MNGHIPLMPVPQVMDRELMMRVDYMMGMINQQDAAIRMLINKVEIGEKRNEEIVRQNEEIIRKNEEMRRKNEEMEERIRRLEGDLEEHKRVAVVKRQMRKVGRYVPPQLRVREEKEKESLDEEKLRELWGGVDSENSGRGTPLYFGAEKSIW